MRVYIVVTVFAGCVNEVEGFLDMGEAQIHLVDKQGELGMEPGLESESEHDVQLHELDIVVYPPSVAARRQIV